ncbi:hypothetical protein RchiOBHm_Chr5g0061001 [Rosa chinensis]|uniref:Uncharacterized protein n=1 Tax=Rosa chinensis TaxID=74649 RepID=A0A2P6QHT8_ROSCH|nr:hypothetical protein RchiOBHm_Chr5g0061001 [Rosa chinensis]
MTCRCSDLRCCRSFSRHSSFRIMNPHVATKTLISLKRPVANFAHMLFAILHCSFFSTSRSTSSQLSTKPRFTHFYTRITLCILGTKHRFTHFYTRITLCSILSTKPRFTHFQTRTTLCSILGTKPRFTYFHTRTSRSATFTIPAESLRCL